MNVPDHALQLCFDQDPAEHELRRIVASARPCFGVGVDEDDEQLRITPRPFPLRWLIASVLALTGLLASLPLFGPALGIDDHVVQRTLRWLAIVVPALGFVGLWFVIWRTRRDRDALAPAAVVERRSGALALPSIDMTVPRERVVRFVHVRARLRRGSVVQPVAQLGVVFRDARERFVYTPITPVLVAGNGRRAAQRLADHYDLQVQRVDAGLL